MIYNSEPYLSVFESETREETIENRIRNKNIAKYRCKTIEAGRRLECEIYPIWNTRSEVRKAKANKSRKAQEKLNHWNRQKKITRWANQNFGVEDYWGTVTYDDKHCPSSQEHARRDMVNYLRRVKRVYKKLGIEFKYLYTTAFVEGQRPHHHFFISGGADRTLLEQMWQGGAIREVRRIQKQNNGVTGIAMYISRAAHGTMRWSKSQNLKPPKESIADNKISRRRASKLAECENSAHEIFEKLYTGYQFRSIKPKHSKYVSGVYMYVEMWRKDPDYDVRENHGTA